MEVEVQKRAGTGGAVVAKGQPFAAMGAAAPSPDVAPRVKRRLSNLDITRISLVGMGANRRTILAKSVDADGRESVDLAVRIVKADAARQMVYGVVYAPRPP